MTRTIVLLMLATLLVPDALAHDAGSNESAGVELQVSAAANDAVQVVERFLHHLAAGEVDAAAAYLDDKLLVLEAGGAERSRDEYLSAHAHADAEFLAGVQVQLRHRVGRCHRVAGLGDERKRDEGCGRSGDRRRRDDAVAKD